MERHNADLSAAHVTRLERRLQQIQADYRALLHSSGEAVVMLDAQGRIQGFNRSAEQIFAYVARDVLKQPIGLLIVEHDLLQAAIEGEEDWISAALSSRRYELTGRRSDGHAFAMSAAINVIDRAGVRRVMLVLSDVSEHRQREAHIEHMAQHDALTELPNRVLLLDRLERAIGRARGARGTVGVLMFDVDQFRRVNDALGHDAGDQLLLLMARRLLAQLRPGEVGARIGGDEFAVLLDPLADERAAEHRARELLAGLTQPVQIGGHDLHLTISAGVSCFPHDADGSGVLLKNAEAAMYHVKSVGLSGVQRFNAEMQRRADDKLALENDMRRALIHGEFVMHYEPQISLSSGQVIGVEALIRWNHPQRGWVPPMSFIPLAEETGLIEMIGAWTLRAATAEAQQLEQRLGCELSLAVNLSPRQFAQIDLVDVIRDACARAQWPTHKLVLEVTEGMLVINPDETVRLLQELRAMGVRVAIDDFGTGYSSLSYLTRFPVDLLKIDRSFVRDLLEDPADAAVASAIIAMAHALGIPVIAEGVETLEQLQALQARGCDNAQGYLIGRSKSADEIVLPTLDAGVFGG
ncbi:bifunctional diguanylate cyclase/phosphodiesterase [Sinimarinibacterium sp. NLF-5-8]|uniref:putative bifunctional diguanylate cyclase/phosphodiesterase n=1 Tax=Sinimarinibacterium sp. NLF-5-8 TaxID=2698684 RepID=UPI00137C21C9|nr:GGDEF domain-containing phosphodiesterase [Sinimarinibacterium sp. NLF-5-8]QHS10369.1 EAL domain-containing protein [Sinimarinibacterium sp. NLF-5-8]